MVIKIALGIVLGTLLVRWIHHRRLCHGHGLGFGFRFRRRFILFAARDLGLTPEQVEALRPLWLSARNAVATARFGHAQAAHGLMSALAAEPLDRGRLDAVAARHAEDQAQAGKDLVAAIARAHEILTPEQREKLRARTFRHGFAQPRGPGFGPYRM